MSNNNVLYLTSISIVLMNVLPCMFVRFALVSWDDIDEDLRIGGAGADLLFGLVLSSGSKV